MPGKDQTALDPSMEKGFFVLDKFAGIGYKIKAWAQLWVHTKLWLHQTTSRQHQSGGVLLKRAVDLDTARMAGGPGHN